MAKQTLKKKVQAKPEVGKFAEPVFETAREFWLAGLGVFAVAQQEGGKFFEQGNKLFSDLVSEGKEFQKKTIGAAENTVDEFVDDVESRFDAIRQQAVENWEHLGHTFDERVSETLERLGIPNTGDYDKLSSNLQKVSRQAVKNWKDLESVFEERVSRALKQLRVPDADDLNKVSADLQKVSRDAAESFANLESMFEKRVTAVLGGLGIPTREDTGKLSAELQKLSGQVNALEKKLAAENAPVKQPAAKKPVAKKPVAEKPVAKKPEVA